MINLQVLHGLRIQGHTNLKKVVTTEEGRRLAHIDGWAALIDPDYCNPDDNEICNRALREEMIPISTGNVILGNFDDGPTAFNTDDGTDEEEEGAFIRVNADVDVNPEAWTYFAVIEPAPNNTTIQRFISPVETGNTEEVFFNIGMNNTLNSIVVYETSVLSGGQPQRLRYAVPSERRGTRALVMVTFSVREGVKIFWNGELVAENREDRRPLTRGFGAGEWVMFRSLRGNVGMSGVLNIDMSEVEHEGDRLTLEQFMIEKYSIITD